MITIATGLAIATISFIGLVFASHQAWARWRAHYVPQVDDLAVDMRGRFKEVINNNPGPAGTLTYGKSSAPDVKLRDIRRQIRDRTLYGQLGDLLDCWRRMQSNPSIEVAMEGVEQVQTVLDRCSHLTRWIVGDVK